MDRSDKHQDETGHAPKMPRFDSEADWQEFVEQTQRQLLRYARRRGLTIEEAEDAVAHAYGRLQAELATGKFQDRRHLDDWLRKVIRNKAKDIQKKGARWPPAFEELKATEEVDLDYHDRLGLDAAETRKRILSWFREDDRELIWLRIAEGKSYKEIARYLEIPEKGLRERVFKALRAVRERSPKGEP